MQTVNKAAEFYHLFMVEINIIAINTHNWLKFRPYTKAYWRVFMLFKSIYSLIKKESLIINEI